MTEQRGLAPIFLRRLSEQLQSRLGSLSHLEGVLGDILEEGRSAWPGVNLAPEEFLAYLAQRLPEDNDAERTLLELKASDLYLACACARGDHRALTYFETKLLPEIQAALLKRDPSFQVEEMKQILFQKLLLPDGANPPRITKYSGRGDLRSWVCVTAVREAIDHHRKNQREQALDDGALADLASDGGDQELSYLKRIYREEFKAAFQESLGALSSRERNVLRHNLLDGLNIDQIGAIYNVHRATVARWIAKARETLLTETRTLLMKRLRVDQNEFESIMRLIQSRFDVSIHHFLKKDPH